MGNGMNKVLPGLYVGNFRDSKDQEQLNKHNITHILAIHDNARKLPCNNDKEYLCIIASDSPGQNLTQFFPVCNDFIHTARLKGGNILIHCLAGMSRSVTVAVVYVMCVTSLRWRDALKAVQGARNVANPNVGFLKQLQEFEKERLQEERRRIREKYPESNLSEEDEQMVKDLLTSYYHYMSVGEMCDGNCQQGVTCPRGLCNQPRSCGIFRRNSRETSSYSRSSSPLGNRSSSLANMNTSPKCSPEHSRNPSPTSSPVSQRVSANILTPPMLFYQSQRTNNESFDSLVSYPESPSRARKICGSFYGQPTPPGSPSKSYSYYTSSPAKSPTSSLPNSIKGINSPGGGSGSIPGSPSRSFKQGKVLRCPSTPPRKNPNVSQLTPPSSPMRMPKNKTNRDGNTSPTRTNNRDDTTESASSQGKKAGEQGNKRNARISFKDELSSSSPQKRITRLCQRETKSLDLSSPPTTPASERSPDKKNPTPQQSVPSSPAKRSIKTRLHSTRNSPSRFCQAVTRLLPQIATLNSSSRLCKNIAKPFARTEFAALYVDEKGRSSLKPTKKSEDTSSLSSSIELRTSTNTPSISFDDEDEDTRVVIFELCKNIQKFPKETEINYEPSTKTVESDLAPERARTTSLHTTIDISMYTNTANTNIIINPIFSLENKYQADSLCNNKPTIKQNGKANFTAFLEDDIIYVQTTESDSTSEAKVAGESRPAHNNNRETGVIVPDSTLMPISPQMDIRVNPCGNELVPKQFELETKPDEVEDSSGSDLSPGQNFQRDFSICKRNSSSFKPEEDCRSSKQESFAPQIMTRTTGRVLAASQVVRNPLEQNSRSKMHRILKDLCPAPFPTIHTPPESSSKSSRRNVSRPQSGPPPPLPPRKGMSNPSNALPLTPPPVPPRNMKPRGQSPPADKTASH